MMKGSPFKAGAHEKVSLPPQYINTFLRKSSKIIFGQFLALHVQEYFDGNPFKSEHPDQATFKEPERHGMDGKIFKPSNPGKAPGGMCAGTFNPWPTHSEDKYTGPNQSTLIKEAVNSSGKKFVPSSGPRPYPISSVLEAMVHK